MHGESLKSSLPAFAIRLCISTRALHRALAGRFVVGMAEKARFAHARFGKPGALLFEARCPVLAPDRSKKGLLLHCSLERAC